VLVITRFRAPSESPDSFAAALRAAVDAFAARPGYVDGFAGRNLDDPALWTLTTRWANVGAYRRALSAYEVKVATAAPYAHAVEEPSAYTDAYQDVVGSDAPSDGNR
jgi:quinol monooxygenase YgiN